MTPNPIPSPPENRRLADLINAALTAYSDKDWNYSRISLVPIQLKDWESPYALTIELLDLRTKIGRAAFKSCESELTWGSRHSNELSILELISLRLNQALTSCTSDEQWNYQRPVVRLSKREELVAKGLTDALWYSVKEVDGEDFDNR